MGDGGMAGSHSAGDEDPVAVAQSERDGGLRGSAGDSSVTLKRPKDTKLPARSCLGHQNSRGQRQGHRIRKIAPVPREDLGSNRGNRPRDITRGERRSKESGHVGHVVEPDPSHDEGREAVPHGHVDIRRRWTAATGNDGEDAGTHARNRTQRPLPFGLINIHCGLRRAVDGRALLGLGRFNP